MKSELALLLKALAFAAHKHRDQRRKDPAASPYINHPIALADVLVNEGGVTDVEVLCAALLHDTVEDTDTTPQEIEGAFGARVARIVAEVVDHPSTKLYVQHFRRRKNYRRLKGHRQPYTRVQVHSIALAGGEPAANS